jgi:hypothetical protein
MTVVTTVGGIAVIGGGSDGATVTVSGAGGITGAAGARRLGRRAQRMRPGTRTERKRTPVLLS